MNVFNYYYLDLSIYFPIHKTIFKYWIPTYKLCVSILPVEGGERWGEGGRVVLHLARTIYMPPRERDIYNFAALLGVSNYGS